MSAMAESSSTSYIRLVQHLIEECLLFKMSKEESVEALTKHAQIDPIITSTVWKELEKENKEFFEAYEKTRTQSADARNHCEENKAAAMAMEEEGDHEKEEAKTPKQEIQNDPNSVPT